MNDSRSFLAFRLNSAFNVMNSSHFLLHLTSFLFSVVLIVSSDNNFLLFIIFFFGITFSAYDNTVSLISSHNSFGVFSDIFSFSRISNLLDKATM